jgi:hypothetical protein
MKVVAKYLEEHAETLHEDYIGSAVLALRDVWPCHLRDKCEFRFC